jgi:hypothetical protein
VPNDYILLAIVAALSIGGGLFLLRQAKPPPRSPKGPITASELSTKAVDVSH